MVKRLCNATLAIMSCFFMADSNSAQTWTQTSAPSTNWQSVAVSADGRVLVAATGHQVAVGNLVGGIFVSTNSGTSWAQTSAPGTNFYNSVAMSADGMRLAASFIYHNAASGGVCYSADSGTTWILSSAVISPHFIGFPHFVASSSDGTKLVAVGGSIYTSADGGVNWSSNSLSANWASAASSADGNKLAAVALGGSAVFLSTNAGISWTSNSVPYGKFIDVALSADGSHVIAAGNPQIPGPIYTSPDFGVTWISNNAPVSDWGSVASSADGSKLSAATTAVVYASTNSENAFAANSPIYTAGISSVACSADGALSVITTGNGNIIGGIYVCRTAASPAMDLLSSNGNLNFSWLVPSTNFVLQQSADLAGWMDVTNVPVLNLTNLHNEVSLPSSGSNGFFRLKTL